MLEANKIKLTDISTNNQFIVDYKDVPSWAKGNRPSKNESGKDFAKRLLDKKYGKGNYSKGPRSDFNKIKKWGNRAFE